MLLRDGRGRHHAGESHEAGGSPRTHYRPSTNVASRVGNDFSCSGNVIVRPAALSEPSLDAKPLMITSPPTVKSVFFRPRFSMRNGEPVSTFQFSSSPSAFFTST